MMVFAANIECRLRTKKVSIQPRETSVELPPQVACAFVLI